MQSTLSRRLPVGTPARDFPNYPAHNAWGPVEADALIQRDGRSWRQL